MKMTDFLRELFEAGRFKPSLNLMDRKVFVQVGKESVPIESIEIDYKGDVRLYIDEDLLNSWRESKWLFHSNKS